MQSTDQLINSYDTQPPQRGFAEIAPHTGVTMHEISPITKVALSPQARRMKRAQSNGDNERAQQADNSRQIESARANAYSAYKKRNTEFSPEQVSAYAQWILQANQVLEMMRLNEERGIR